MRYSLRTKRHGVVSLFLIGFPLICMIVSVLMEGGDLTGANANYSICNPNASNCNPGQPSSSGGTATSGATTFTCNQQLIAAILNVPCSIPGPCPSNPPQPTSCSIAGVWLLANGHSVTVQNSLLFQQSGGHGLQGIIPAGTPFIGASSTNGVFFGLGTIGSTGFIVVIGVVVGIVILASLQIWGSGISPEAIHILFMGGLLAGIWILLSTLDGFTTGSKSSMFNQLNFFSVGGLGVGNLGYVVLTFMYLVGFMGMVKRGAN